MRQKRCSASQRKPTTSRKGTQNDIQYIEQQKDNMDTQSPKAVSEPFPVPQVFAINVDNTLSADVNVSEQPLALTITSMEVAFSFNSQQGVSDVVRMEGQATQQDVALPATTSCKPTLKPDSRSAKGGVTPPPLSGPRIQTNIAHFKPNSAMVLGNAVSSGSSEVFSLPAKFTFNAANELPKAMLESRSLKPPDLLYSTMSASVSPAAT